MQEYKATDYTMKNNYGLPSSYKASIETSPAGKDYQVQTKNIMDKLMRDLNSKSKLNKYECISFDSYPDKESTVWKDDQQRSEYTGQSLTREEQAGRYEQNQESKSIISYEYDRLKNSPKMNLVRQSRDEMEIGKSYDSKNFVPIDSQVKQQQKITTEGHVTITQRYSYSQQPQSYTQQPTQLYTQQTQPYLLQQGQLHAQQQSFAQRQPSIVQQTPSNAPQQQVYLPQPTYLPLVQQQSRSRLLLPQIQTASSPDNHLPSSARVSSSSARIVVSPPKNKPQNSRIVYLRQASPHKQSPNIVFNSHSPPLNIQQNFPSATTTVQYMSSYPVSSQPIQQNPSSTKSIPDSTHDMVSRVQYERCLTECKNWQTKYEELHLKYLSTISGGSDVVFLKEENLRLQHNVKQLSDKERTLRSALQRNFTELINKYKQSTLKEAMLLVDRYRLQCKQKERDRY